MSRERDRVGRKSFDVTHILTAQDRIDSSCSDKWLAIERRCLHRRRDQDNPHCTWADAFNHTVDILLRHLPNRFQRELQAVAHLLVVHKQRVDRRKDRRSGSVVRQQGRRQRQVAERVEFNGRQSTGGIRSSSSFTPERECKRGDRPPWRASHRWTIGRPDHEASESDGYTTGSDQMRRE